MSDTTPFIIDVSAADFDTVVLEQSKRVPVVVDFWAPWCGPCKLLGPVLEKLATEYAGQFILAKANIDTMPDLAGAAGVQSIPAVYGVRGGRLVDSFVGLISEPEIRAFLDRLLPTPTQRLAAEAKELEATEPALAEARYREALEQTPNDPDVLTGLLRVLIGAERIDEAQEVMAQLERRGYLEPEAERLKSALQLRAGAADAGPLDAARAEAEAHPQDLAARFRWAEALAATGRHVEALEIALDLVERDRKGLGEDARKLMLAVFNVLGSDSEIASEYRRKLAFVV